MAAQLVECIPNFSEARRPEVVEKIRQAICDVPGTHILDQHSDLDHNRTVITFIGSPAAVEEAAFQAIAIAARLIDLNVHTGQHPRIGATDVVPFVPISEISMTDCVEMARRLGKRAAQELNIPVYLYEEAATRPERQNLENIRRGEYEQLKLDIKTNPERQPDFGPAELGPAGATVIGARQPLIAYNVYLTTEAVEIAQKIAKGVRNSSGGMHFVKALGVLVEGRAQVSMNLTNYRQSPIGRVVEMIRREAQRYGVAIHHCELVGLIPQEALFDAATWYLQLDGFNAGQVLENRLFEAQTSAVAAGAATPTQGSSFLDELAAGTAAPGGGSAAAYAGAAAAALVAMVARLTVGKKKYAAVEPQMYDLIEKSEALRASLTAAIQEDSAAFEEVMAAMKLPKNTPEEQVTHSNALEQATLVAIAVPLRTAALATNSMELAIQVASSGNLNAISDAASAAALGRASLTGAGLNVRINCAGLLDQARGADFIRQVIALEIRADQLDTELKQILIERANLNS
jgi:glutamate formiminotransferase/formiminotetrahydrofolate cyclodeaminase